MKIQLKNVKHADFASQETHCYSASVWVDGKRIGTVENDGRGGSDLFEGDQAAYKLADDYCKTKGEWHNLEGECCDLVNRWLMARDLKRMLKKRILFAKEGRIFEIGTKPTALALAQFKARRAGVVPLNEMEFEAALDLFAKMAQ